MITRNGHTFFIIVVVLTMLTELLSSCVPRPTVVSPLPSVTAVISTDAPYPTLTWTPSDTPFPTLTWTPAVTPTPTRTRMPTPTRVPLPFLAWNPGEGYFRLNGKPAFLFSRNPAGWKPSDWATIAGMAHQQSDHFVRVGTSSASMGGYHGYGYTPRGEIQEDWSNNWENFFDTAEVNGLYVLPIFGGWIDWNDTGYNTWRDNPFNSSNGGPAGDPREIFKKDSPTQLLYLKWFKMVVTRWSAHKNTLAWEAVTEVNLINGISQSEGIYFAEQLAKVVREADTLHRPVTSSVADYSGWTNFLHSDALDFISLHPYALPDGKLDIYLLQEVRQYMDLYHKPVLIGESGLRAATPDSADGKITVLPNARIGIQHAIWADLVSGAMNGRALWWEDGYGIYFPALGMYWVEKYTDVEAPVVQFSAGVNMDGFKPIPAWASGKVFGAALGNEKMVIGWYRDASCEPPDWNMEPVISNQTVTLTIPGTAASWLVDFYNTKTGTEIVSSTTVTRNGGTITITLPDFTDDIAFKIHAQK